MDSTERNLEEFRTYERLPYEGVSIIEGHQYLEPYCPLVLEIMVTLLAVTSAAIPCLIIVYNGDFSKGS